MKISLLKYRCNLPWTSSGNSRPALITYSHFKHWSRILRTLPVNGEKWTGEPFESEQCVRNWRTCGQTNGSLDSRLITRERLLFLKTHRRTHPALYLRRTGFQRAFITSSDCEHKQALIRANQKFEAIERSLPKVLAKVFFAKLPNFLSKVFLVKVFFCFEFPKAFERAALGVCVF